MPIIIRTQNENTGHFTVFCILPRLWHSSVPQTYNTSDRHDFEFSSTYALKKMLKFYFTNISKIQSPQHMAPATLEVLRKSTQ